MDGNDFLTRVLVAVVEGYQARSGMKDRIRALNEWEIARRCGYTEISYAEYAEHPVRDQVLTALLALQRRGLVAVWDHGAKYDTFAPSETGTQTVTAGSAAVEDSTRPGTITAALEQAAPAAARDGDPMLARLDEIIRLLRAIDAKLGT